MTRPRGVLAAALLSLALLPALAHAQDEPERSVEGRLLQILKDRGVISSDEYRDLQGLAEDLRREGDLETKLDAEVSQLVAHLQDAQPRTSYQVGRGFTFETPDKQFLLHLGGRLQARFTYGFWDQNSGKNNESEPDFSVPRARIWLQGHAFGPSLKYKLQFDIAGDEADTNVTLGGNTGKFSSSNRLTELKDAYFEWAEYPYFRVRGGQFKTPYSHQELTSSGHQEFVDRSITNKAFAPGRNPGVMVLGTAGGEKGDLFEYYAGAFNGEGENFKNNDEGLMFVGRVAVNPFGAVKYSESDLKGSQDFLLAVGANAWYHMNDNHANANDQWSIGGDVTALYNGLFFTGEIHYMENEQTNPTTETWGWHAQLGYMIIPHTFEIAVRAATVDSDDDPAGDADSREYLVGVGYFWEEHDLKVQADFGYVDNGNTNASARTDGYVLRIQFQMIF